MRRVQTYQYGLVIILAASALWAVPAYLRDMHRAKVHRAQVAEAKAIQHRADTRPFPVSHGHPPATAKVEGHANRAKHRKEIRDRLGLH